MAMNRVRFQPDLSMVEFMQHYGIEAKCYRALYGARWPERSLPGTQRAPGSRFRRGAQVYCTASAARAGTRQLPIWPFITHPKDSTRQPAPRGIGLSYRIVTAAPIPRTQPHSKPSSASTATYRKHCWNGVIVLHPLHDRKIRRRPRKFI